MFQRRSIRLIHDIHLKAATLVYPGPVQTALRTARERADTVPTQFLHYFNDTFVFRTIFTVLNMQEDMQEPLRFGSCH